MRGMLSLLEKAGLVRVDPIDQPTEELPRAAGSTEANSRPAPGVSVATTEAALQAAIPAAPLALGEIYTKAGVAPSNYPAERLLRLLEGLSAMEEPVRLMAIQAMDAADESWTIQDPLADAQAKLQALAMHAELLELNLQAQERDTQKHTQAVNARQEKVSADIRQQIAELEALMAREVAKATQEVTRQEALLSKARDKTASELTNLTQLTTQFQNLIARFGSHSAASPNAPTSAPKE